ncbi:MAG: DNA-3-methyladenine glycosylase [Microcystaceae cyanobacterium]
MTTPSYWPQAQSALSQQDKVLGGLIAAYPDQNLINHHNPFYTLVKAVIGQQISVKAAEAVWQRLKALLTSISPQAYLQLSEADLRECGLSRQKIAYITNIAQAFQSGILDPADWAEMDDEGILKQLMSIRGVGIWTAQMFLIFHLHRPDILPLSDLGLVNAIHRHYSQDKTLSKPEMIELSQQWKPYRTVATWYLWRSLDPVVIQY